MLITIAALRPVHNLPTPNQLSLYALNLETFSLAMEILKEWRLDRYYAQKGSKRPATPP